jgi:hypothetical protein
MTHEATETCLSNLRIDCLMTGDLDRAATREAERHLASCARCSAQLRELTRVADDLFARRPTLGWTGRVPPPSETAPRSGRWWRGLGTRSALAATVASVASVAAVALLFLGRPSGDQRSKGAGLVFETYALTPKGDVALVLDGEHLSPGDRLRFRITSSQPGYVGVVSVDPTGEVSSYLPPAPRLEPLQAGRPVELKGSCELDGRLGSERLIAVVCPGPMETTAVLRAVPHHLSELVGCATATLSFQKALRSQ